jgi:hypothetical protein
VELSADGIVDVTKRIEWLTMPGKMKNDIEQQHTDALYEAATAFWSTARKCHKEHFTTIGCEEADIKFLISLVSYETASDHLEALRAEKEAVKHQARTRSIPAKIDDSDVAQTYWGTPTTETSHSGEKAQKEKTKVKSRLKNPVCDHPPATNPALQDPRWPPRHQGISKRYSSRHQGKAREPQDIHEHVPIGRRHQHAAKKRVFSTGEISSAP